MTTAVAHVFASTKADGPDATLVQPGDWNANHNPFLSMTNRSGAAVVQYGACAVGTANDDSFTTTTTQYDTRPLVVVQPAAGIANATAGTVQNLFQTVVNVQGNVTRGNWLRFSATAGRLEDAGIAGTSSAPYGANAIAVTGYAGGGAGTVTATLLGSTASILPGGTTGTSGGVPYFNATTTVASSALLTLNALIRGGGAGAAPVAMTGTSGGVPYFDAATTVASSGALTANALVLGGGAGAAPTALALGTAFQHLRMNSGATASEWAGVAPTIQVFTANGTYTKPAGLTAALVITTGGGGGGGAANVATAGGGGGGGTAIELLAASAIGATETVTIGASASGGGAGTNNAGTAGNTSSFGALNSATGGAGGGGGTSGTGGNGGTGSGGSLNFDGGDGETGSATNGVGGGGGSSFLGGEARNDARPGHSYGGGGGAGFNGGGGGAGAAGAVVVLEFY